MKLKALTDMSLRRSANPNDPAWKEWYEWKAGETFDAPPNLNVERALARGIAEKVKGASDDG